VICFIVGKYFRKILDYAGDITLGVSVVMPVIVQVIFMVMSWTEEDKPDEILSLKFQRGNAMQAVILIMMCTDDPTRIFIRAILNIFSTVALLELHELTLQQKLAIYAQLVLNIILREVVLRYIYSVLKRLFNKLQHTKLLNKQIYFLLEQIPIGSIIVNVQNETPKVVYRNSAINKITRTWQSSVDLQPEV